MRPDGRAISECRSSPMVEQGSLVGGAEARFAAEFKQVEVPSIVQVARRNGGVSV